MPCASEAPAVRDPGEHPLRTQVMLISTQMAMLDVGTFRAASTTPGWQSRGAAGGCRPHYRQSRAEALGECQLLSACCPPDEGTQRDQPCSGWVHLGRRTEKGRAAKVATNVAVVITILFLLQVCRAGRWQAISGLFSNPVQAGGLHTQSFAPAPVPICVCVCESVCLQSLKGAKQNDMYVSC